MNTAIKATLVKTATRRSRRSRQERFRDYVRKKRRRWLAVYRTAGRARFIDVFAGDWGSLDQKSFALLIYKAEGERRKAKGKSLTRPI